METTPETAAPSTPTVEALATMRDHDLGCLPVVQGEMLVGLVTKRALLDLTIRLIDGQLRAQD